MIAQVKQEGLLLTIEELDAWFATQDCFTEPAVFRLEQLVDGKRSLWLDVFINNKKHTITGSVPEDLLENLVKSATYRALLLEPLKRKLETLVVMSFYERHYERVSFGKFNDLKYKTREKEKSNKCRFCQKRSPEVTFKSIAHAVPESIGNKYIFCPTECDTCNKFFGSTIENEFGKWSKQHRTLAQVSGKGGIPQLGRSDGSWNIKCIGDTTQIKVTDDYQMFEYDEAANKINLSIVMESFVPQAVYKTFCKMALSLAEESDLPHLSKISNWVLDPDHTKPAPVNRANIVETFYEGSRPLGWGGVELLRRRSDEQDKPFYTLIVAFGLFCYQIGLPKDTDAQQAEFNVPPFSSSMMNFSDWKSTINVLDFSSGIDFAKGPAKELKSLDANRTEVQF
ncbi:MAG: hypothetical protein QG574_4130 [Cyanobacteriota bacterium erpe_2018_sw_21hr_WHONDRS-SW48-000092_B_bin.40]|jgi:hypothetical protein|nr:hypothetical protein [Cyanobacteriota bacterium erpe_2018_sw_21hr_WHONDRS-SW48-000092_B_bin.40]